jgi:hypothetical protein
MEEGLDAKPEPVASRFPAPSRMALEGEVGLRDFWQGNSIPELPPTPKGPGVPALLIKKQGDYPPFWPGEALEVQEVRLRTFRLASAAPCKRLQFVCGKMGVVIP